MGISREEFIFEVGNMYDSYQPNPHVLNQCGGIDVTTVSAPAGMGKDTLIAATGIPRVLAETIRSERMNNGVMERSGVEYEFRGHELDIVLAQLKRGEHVQIGMGPGRDSFYGSRISNYPQQGPALMDVMTSQVEAVRKLPFASAAAAMVVAPSYESWLSRLESRGKFTPTEWTKRRREAASSLQDGLEDHRYVFILNDELEVAAKALHDFAKDRHYNQAQSIIARNVANGILSRLTT
jgi:guanylate kinase